MSRYLNPKTDVMKSKIFFALFFGMFTGMITVDAQTIPGFDNRAVVLMDFENGSVEGWRTGSAGRGEQTSVELMDAEMGDPVRFGRYAIRLNWDFTSAQPNQTLGAYFAPPANAFVIPAAPNPKKLGMWIYASPEMRNIWFRIQLFNPPGSQGAVAVWGNEPSYDRFINWTGWRYHEFDAPAGGNNVPLGPPGNVTASHAMFRLMQEMNRNPADGSMLASGYVIIDNIRWLPGSFSNSGVEDLTPPVIDNLTGNGTNLSGATFTTSAISLSASFHDNHANSSGINYNSIRMIVNGYAFKAGDPGFEINEGTNTVTLSGISLSNGTHNAVAHVEDNFGHITTRRGEFTINAEDRTTTAVSLEPVAEAHVGNPFEMKIITNDLKDIKELNLEIRLGELGSIDETGGVVFAESAQESIYSFNSRLRILTINLKNDVDVAEAGAGTLATIKVNIPKNGYPTDVLRCSPVTARVIYADNSLSLFSLFNAFTRNVLATYDLTIRAHIGISGTVTVNCQSGNPVFGATVHVFATNGTLIESVDTDHSGVASGMNFTNVSQQVEIYAEKDGNYSFTNVVRTLRTLHTIAPTYISSGTTPDPTTSKTITWMSSLVGHSGNAFMKMAKKVDGANAFTQHQGITKVIEYRAIASSGATMGSSVTVADLAPGTTYIYQVGDGVNWSPTREFTTTTVTDKFSFAVFGDLQATSRSDMNRWLAAAQTVEAMSVKPFFSLNVADVVDTDDRYDYYSHYGHLFNERQAYANIDMVYAYGNHEYMGTPDADNIKFAAGTPRVEHSANYNHQLVGTGSYAVEYGNMIVIALDWEARTGASATAHMQAKAEWMDYILSQTDKTWKIVTLHYPIFPSASTAGSQAIYGRIFDKHNVQVVFCGHGHTFERVLVHQNNVISPSGNRRTFQPDPRATGTLHFQVGGMKETNAQGRWILCEVDGKKMFFTVRDHLNNIVDNECFTLFASPQILHAVTFNAVNADKGSLTASVDGKAIVSRAEVENGKEVVFTATPNVNSHVKEWKINGAVVANNTTNSLTLTVAAATVVTVEFITTSVATSVESLFASDINIYPNPFMDTVRITGAENSMLRVINASGAVVYIQKITNADEVIHLEQLSTGVYIFIVESDGQSKTVTVVKE